MAVNLAASLARAGKRTLLIDTDLRQSSLARLCGLAAGRDLARVLREEQTASEAVQRCPIENLDAIAAGQETTRFTELLLSPRLQDALSELRDQYDTVVIDAPAVLEAPDACLLGTMADGVLLVVRESVTESGDAEKAARLLRGLNTALLGVLFNGAQGKDTGAVNQTVSVLIAGGQDEADATEEEKEMAGAK